MGACGRCRFFLLELSGIAFFARRISIYIEDVTTALARATKTDAKLTACRVPKTSIGSMLLVNAIWLLWEESYPGEGHGAII